jgi:predicted TIM-barrel fold metal-dependent hydrolase
MKIKYYDCHCHVFNKHVLDFHLLVRIFLSLPDILKKSDDLYDPDKNQTIGDKIKNRINRLKRIINFLKAGFSKTDEDVFAKMKETYGETFAIVPLMFDLEYCFIGKRASCRIIQTPNIKTINSSLISFTDKFLNLKHNLIKKTPGEPSGPTTREKKEEVKDTHLNEHNFISRLASSYKKQMHDIIKLKTNFSTAIFPFIAIDPRRQGIIDMFINEIYPQQIFTGVKLYTPLGYSPTDEDLMKKGGLYEFCEKYQIPVTAHFSHVGFATPLQHVEIFGDIYDNGKVVPQHGYLKLSRVFSNGWVQERSEKFNHPELWRKVLNVYPNLKLNLAHFGLDSEKWRETIFDMMETYKNLYTDLSRYTSICDLIYIKRNYFNSACPEVKNKFLYGSDFYFDLLYINSLDHYVSNFMKVFNSEEFTLIAQTNAKKFLNINNDDH